MNPAGLGIARSFPQPNTGAAGSRFNNYATGANLSDDKFNNLIGRVDQSIGEKQRLFYRYAWNKRTQVDNGFQNFQGPGLDAQDPLIRLNHNAVVDSVTVLSPSVILNIRAGLTRYIEEAQRQRVFGYDITQLGFSQNFANQRFDPIPPAIRVQDFTDWGSRNARYNVSNIISLQPSVSWIVGGNHSLKFGGDFRDIRLNPASGSFVRGGGEFAFNRAFTQRVPNFAENNSGAGLASLLLGAPASGFIQSTPRLAYRWGYNALYINDDWRITPRLTLNLGLRWDVEGAPTERYNRQNRGFSTTAADPLLAAAARTANAADCPACANLVGGLLFAGEGGNPREAFDTDYNHFQPRIGAVYQLTDNTIVRGGFGTFYLPTALLGGALGFAADTQFVPTVGGNEQAFIPANTLENPFPTLFTPVGSSQGLGTFAGGNIVYGDPNRKIPYTHQYSFGIQHQLPWSVRIDASYVGSRTHDINTGENQAGGARNINVIPLSALERGRQDPQYLNQAVPNPFAGLLPGTNLNAATVQRQQLLRPFPQFGNVVVSGESVGKIWYDAFQLSVEKRYTQGLVMVLAYTWSKNLEAVAFANSQDLEPTKNLTSQDRPHRAVFSGSWELPFGRGRKWLSDAGRATTLLLGGWQYNWITTLQSGTPIDLPGDVYQLRNPSLENQSFDRYFNNCVANVAGTSAQQPNATLNGFVPCTDPAWQLRGPNTLRTTQFRTGDIRAPFRPQWDMSVNKRFIITESMNAQFRFEMFNAFNTAIRVGPSTNATASNFGFIPANASNQPRRIQLGLKFNF